MIYSEKLELFLGKSRKVWKILEIILISEIFILFMKYSSYFPAQEFGFTNQAGQESIHSHNISRPFSYSHNFTYTYPQKDVDMSGASAYVDVDVSDEEKIDQLVTPFILVEYIIKF